MEIFDEAARKRIEAAIADVEARSAGELVVTTIPESDDYHDIRALYGAALAISSAALVHWIWPAWPVTWLLWIELVTMALGFWLLGVGPLLRHIVPRARIAQSVQQRAKEAFLAHELFATRDRSGVLILISEREHHIAILGDSGIHARLAPGAWESEVARIARGFREGNAADGICAVIAELGEVLATHFPARADDKNELSNAVRPSSE